MGMYYLAGMPFSAELYHHGVAGQKHGERRYQYEDGSLTALGREHYGVGPPREKKDGFFKTYAKRALKGMERSIKTKHPWLASDEELQEFLDRSKMEKEYFANIEAKKKSQREARSFIARYAEREVLNYSDTYYKELAKSKFKDKKDNDNNDNKGGKGGKGGKGDKDDKDDHDPKKE